MVEVFIGLSIFFVALTLCAAVGALSYRVLGVHRAGASTSMDGQTALLAGSIALFGILISGIFVFMTFRIDTGAQVAAAEAARQRATEIATEIAEKVAQDAEAKVDRAVEDMRVRINTAVEQVSRRASFLSGTDVPLSTGSQTIEVGTPWTVEFGPEQSLTFEFSARTAGTYAIDAIAESADFDPFLYLYSDGQIVADNDDGGAGLNARLEEELTAGVHTIRVEELAGFPGICQISVMLVAE